MIDREDLIGSLFFPRPDDGVSPPAARDVFVDVPGARLHVRVHAAPDHAPVLLLFHGNGEIVHDWDGLAPAVAAVGYRLVVVDYRGYGRSTGTPTMRRLLDDARPVLAFARTLGPRVVVIGRSLGSAAAWEVASEPGVDAIVIDSGFTDADAFIRRRGLEPSALSADDRARIDAMPKIARSVVPVLFVHAEQDRVISIAEAERGAQARTDATFVRIPDRGHNDLAFHPAYWPALIGFLRSHVPPA